MGARAFDRAVGPLWGALVALAGAMACEDPSKLFTGRWVSQDPSPAELYPGVPTLAIGHYGTHVAGVAFYHVPGGSDPVASCPCGFIEHVGLDVDTRRVSFTTSCEAETEARILWELEMEDTPETEEVWLLGSVRASNGDGPTDTVSLLRQTRALEDEDKQCGTP